MSKRLEVAAHFTPDSPEIVVRYFAIKSLLPLVSRTALNTLIDPAQIEETVNLCAALWRNVGFFFHSMLEIQQIEGQQVSDETLAQLRVENIIEQQGNPGNHLICALTLAYTFEASLTLLQRDQIQHFQNVHIELYKNECNCAHVNLGMADIYELIRAFGTYLQGDANYYFANVYRILDEWLNFPT